MTMTSGIGDWYQGMPFRRAVEICLGIAPSRAGCQDAQGWLEAIS